MNASQYDAVSAGREWAHKHCAFDRPIDDQVSSRVLKIESFEEAAHKAARQFTEQALHLDAWDKRDQEAVALLVEFLGGAIQVWNEYMDQGDSTGEKN